jgi:hypothetical protein
VLPTVRRRGQPFRLGLKGEDKWGNPSQQVSGTFTLKPSRNIDGLPRTIASSAARALA